MSTLDKPAHLQARYGEQWNDVSMAAAYPARPAYPSGVFDVLERLALPSLPVLDLGAGTGDVARPLAARGLAVDAVEPSRAMIAMGRAQPGGDRPNWIPGAAETVDVAGPYGLVTAGACIHWMEWNVVFPRIAEVLPDGALLALCNRPTRVPWESELRAIVPRYSTNVDFKPYDAVEEVASRGYFEERGRERTPFAAMTQPLADYLTSFHSRNGLSVERMGAGAAAAFADEVARAVAPWTKDGRVSFDVAGEVVWGVPTTPTQSAAQ